MYPDRWGYNYGWLSSWIKDHDAVGAKVSKPVVLEEYGAQGTNTTAVEQQWQTTVVTETEIAWDSFRQFGAWLPSGNAITDNYTIECGTAEYQNLVIDHVQAMDVKAVLWLRSTKS